METKLKFPALVDILALSHIYNSIGSGCGAVIGALVTIWHYHLAADLAPILAAALATTLISSAGFIINNIFDINIDRINRPDRPLAAGRISLRFARGLYLVYSVIGILLALSVSPLLG